MNADFSNGSRIAPQSVSVCTLEETDAQDSLSGQFDRSLSFWRRGKCHADRNHCRAGKTNRRKGRLGLRPRLPPESVGRLPPQPLAAAAAPLQPSVGPAGSMGPPRTASLGMAWSSRLARSPGLALIRESPSALQRGFFSMGIRRHARLSPIEPDAGNIPSHATAEFDGRG